MLQQRLEERLEFTLMEEVEKAVQAEKRGCWTACIQGRLVHLRACMKTTKAE